VNLLRNILKVHKKGIIVLPKWVREAVGVNEGDSLLVEIKESKIILTPLIPKRVKLGGKVSEIVRNIKKEEMKFEH